MWEDKELEIFFEDEDIIEADQVVKYWIFQIVACSKCGKRSFREFWHDGTFIENDKEIYPKRGLVFRKKIDFTQVPENLKKIYETTIDLFNEEKKLPCAICQRIIVEGIVKEKFIDSFQLEEKEKKRRKNLGLEKKLNELAHAGIISYNTTNALKTLKNMGNDAAHEMEVPTMRELDFGLRMIESLLKVVYDEHEPEMTKLADQMEKSKKRRRNS
ncbi:MAG: DUF4145 domain-containing protein [Saprospiraceae bacterium]|nr:DUF4145 domain-containing protein [Saprospiraceae bacterium]MCB9356544.1 DUF4145 domain-containing protein [Lewinellaceae bacterium]